MSREQHNVIMGGEGVPTRRNGVNAEETTFFYNFLRMSQRILVTTVAVSRFC